MDLLRQKIHLLNSIANEREYNNSVVSQVNDHVLRLAVIDGEFHWHQHETDELFMVLDGELFIDFENNQTISLKPGEVYTIPAFTQHRTRSNQRTVNICFEKAENNINGIS
ncbi:cupin domain-containing protein [Bacillus sp. 1P06AnD]|uniref:cupin domain-containing protein n=1 Tax=Bacillus sp. 1P06AnD TaxID=3132208 RepID=UPI0039A30722